MMSNEKFIAKKGEPLAGIYEAAVIGVSSGGLEALSVIVPALTNDFALAVTIVQHQHPHSNNFLARHLHAKSRIPVKEAEEKEVIQPGRVYVAPPNYHLLIEADKTFALDISAKVCYARPSVDVLFETAADVYGDRLIGIILTGANSDGSRGLKKIKERGGLTIAQDPFTAEAAAMPTAAIAAAEVDYVLALPEIADLLNQISQIQRHRRQ